MMFGITGIEHLPGRQVGSVSPCTPPLVSAGLSFGRLLATRVANERVNSPGCLGDEERLLLREAWTADFRPGSAPWGSKVFE